MKLSTILILVAILAIDAVAALAVKRQYPLPVTLQHGTSGSYHTTFQFSDGSVVVYRSEGLQKFSNPHMIQPPYPSVARIWAPLFLALTISLIALILAIIYKLLKIKHTFFFGSMAAILLLGIPALIVEIDYNNYYHIHECKDIYEQKSVHPNNFLSRYRRVLFFQSWPGDYKCDWSPHLSMDPPPHEGF